MVFRGCILGSPDFSRLRISEVPTHGPDLSNERLPDAMGGNLVTNFCSSAVCR